MLIPLVAAIMGFKASRKSFFLGAFAGIIGVVTWNFILHNPQGIDGLIIGILCNGAVFFLSTILQKDRPLTASLNNQS